MKVAYLVPRFYPFKGGAEENCYQLAKRVTAAGHEVTVITTDFSPNDQILPATEIIEGMQVIRLHRWNRQLNLGFYPALLPTIWNLDADILHVENGPGFIWQEFCLFWKRVFDHKLKIIVTPHGPFIASKNNTGIRGMIADLAKAVMPLYFKLTWPFIFDKLIAVTPKQDSWLTRDYGILPSKITVITNGIPADTILDSKFINTSAPVVITFTGRFEVYKGVQNILQAMAQIFSRAPELKQKLKFIGMGRVGGYFETLQNMITELDLSDNVKLLQDPDNQTRDQILSEESQIHVLPSQWEATGIVLLEAMAKGNVILTTSANEGAEMLITPGKNGYIYNYDDVDTLAKDLTELALDADLRQRMINANLSKIHQFTWESVFKDYLQLLESLV